MDVSSVTAVTAAPAQSAAAPVTIDAIFGALLQSVTDAENAALATPSVQSAALALVLPANTPAEAGGQQDNATAAPVPQTPWLVAPMPPITPTAQSAMPLPGFPAPATNGQQNADSQIEQSAAALPDTAAKPVLISAPAEDIVLPVATDAPEPVSSAPQQSEPATPPQSRQQPPTELPLPAAIAPEPVPATTPPQSASAQTGSPQTVPSEQQVPTPPSSALDVADQIVAAPAPGDPAPVTAKPATPKTKVAAEPQPEIAKNDDTIKSNTIVDVLAGFLLPQIEPMAAPANDTTADTVDPIASTKSDDQNAAPATDQNAAAPAQPAPVAMVQPPPTSAPTSAPVQADEQPAAAAIGQVPASKTNTPADEPATPAIAQKPATRQQASHQTASEHSQPVFVPANDTAPEPEIQAPTDIRTAPTVADTRPASTADTPQPAQANAPTPAPHQAPAAIANLAIPPAAPSGLRKLTAGLQVAMQEQETVSSIDKLSLTIATKSIDGLRHFDIRLDPPELGRVQVQLTTDDAGRSQANVIVDKPQTLELLQRDAQSLNRALNDAGLDVSNNGLNFSLREQYRQNDGGVDQGRNRSLSVQAVMQTDATQIHSSLGSYAPNSVRLDIRV